MEMNSEDQLELGLDSETTANNNNHRAPGESAPDESVADEGMTVVGLREKRGVRTWGYCNGDFAQKLGEKEVFAPGSDLSK